MTAADEHSCSAKRIALVNPTKFLGNLLIAGGLIQALARECDRRDVSLLLVLDHRYRVLVEPALAGVRIIWYPRDRLKSPWKPKAWLSWLRCVRSIRAFGAELAFPIEEDAVAHQLTRLSGARFRVGSSTARNPSGFHRVLSIPRSDRASPDSHVWFSYFDIFQQLGLSDMLPTAPLYMALPRCTGSQSSALQDRLGSIGVSWRSVRVVLHAGGSKEYKMWPIKHFISLAQALVNRGCQVLLIGSGQSDAITNRAIRAGLHCDEQQVIDLCDQVSLSELAELFRRVRAVVGNDSGPMHLAGAVGASGVVIFGPTDIRLWHPLTETIQVVENRSACDPRCLRRMCYREYACLHRIVPEAVLDRLKAVPI